MLGGALSLAGLCLTGHGEPTVARSSLALLPCLGAGLLVSHVLKGIVPRRQVRLAMLTVCALSAVALITRSLS